jgi:hypothetical protein
MSIRTRLLILLLALAVVPMAFLGAYTMRSHWANSAIA